MISIKNLVSLVAVFALAILFAANASAFATITSVEVSGIQALNAASPVATFAGDTIPVLVIFSATNNASDVRVKAWISGESAYSVSSDRFDVLSGNVYSKLMSVKAPTNIDPSEPLRLEVSIENPSMGVGAQTAISLTAERQSYTVEILSVNMDTKVSAGDSLPLDVVIKNRGRQSADDTFVTVKIPALGVEQRAYFGDLSPLDQANPDKNDAAERRMYVSIPSSAPAGVYVVEINADNADSHTVVSKKLAIVGAAEQSMVVPTTASKTFGAGQSGSYSLTVVNSGNKIGIYQLGFETGSGLTVTANEPVFAIPAGSSKTVTFEATAQTAGTYNFAATVNSNGNLVKRESFTANVEGSSFAGNATVLVTLVLAIVFVVLLVVLIVLLTKKPQKAEEFGESYY